MNNFFGTDGIRGEVGVAPITADFLLKVGWAVGSVLRETEGGAASVIIGKDTRVSGYLFESALEAGFLSAGVNVGMLGPMPSPAIAYLTQAFGASAGVVISASHNPYQDNGVKFFSSKGVKFSNKVQKAIEEKITKPMVSVFKELGASIIMINNTPDGYNINRNCGATDTKQLQQEVLKQDANLGIAFDGDGDRLIMVDHLGEKVDGDELVYIIAKAWKNNGELKSDTVVGTKMTNLGMRKALGELGLTFIEADVGDRHVMDELINNNAVLGGEGSGHIICLNKSTSGDAIIAALQVLEVISKSQKNLYDLKSKMTKYPQVLVNIKIENDINLKNNSNLVDAINLTESKLSDKGRILIRKSGTEALVRVMVECNDLELATESANYLADVIKSM